MKTITLYEIPCIIYFRYKRMRKQGLRDDSCIIILSELNNVSKNDMEHVISQEKQKENRMGLVAYIDTYRQELNNNINTERYSYEISNAKNKKSQKNIQYDY